MRDQSGRILGGQKSQLKISLSIKNKVFGAAKIFATLFLTLAMSSKLDIIIFGNFKVSSLLDTGIWRRAHAATSTTTTMKLKDLPIGGVINLGAYNYVKIADNQFMQTEVATCPDGKTVAGKYVKCFADSNTYTQTCTGSYYCNTSNTTWNSSTGKCDSSVTCPDGSTYCGDNSSWNTTVGKCTAAAGSTYCGTNAEWSSSAGKCVPKSSVCTGSSIWSSASLSCSAPAGSTYCGTNAEWSSTTNKCVPKSSVCSSNTTWNSTNLNCIAPAGNTYCGNNSTWDSTNGKCTAPAGSSYCGTNAEWNSTSSTCVGHAASEFCGTGTIYDSTSGTCVGLCGPNSTDNGSSCTCNSGYYAVSGTSSDPRSSTYAYGGNGCFSFNSTTGAWEQNGTSYYLSSTGTLKTGCNGTMIGGFCWGAISSSTYTWDNRSSGCASGYSVPTVNQFYALENILGCSDTANKKCNAPTTAMWGGPEARYWSATSLDSSYAYTLDVYSSYSSVTTCHKTCRPYVRCIKN